MNENKLYLNIGYPRTGSKTHQFHLFEKHKQINYLGRFPRGNETHLKIIENLMSLSNLEFKEKKEFILETFDRIKFDKNKINLISDEFVVLFESIYNYEATIERTVKRLFEICKNRNIDLKVFFNIRNQTDIISSLYFAANPEFGNSLKFSSIELINYFNSKKNNDYIINFLKVFNYDVIIEKIEKIIGKENIKVFLYEEFKDNPKMYIKNLTDYLKIDLLESEKLLKEKHEHKRNEHYNEDITMNSLSQVIREKLKKNIFEKKFNPLFMKQYFKNFIKILKTQNKLSRNEREEKKILLKSNINLISQNQLLIKNFYKKSNENLNLKINLNNFSKYYF